MKKKKPPIVWRCVCAGLHETVPLWPRVLADNYIVRRHDGWHLGHGACEGEDSFRSLRAAKKFHRLRKNIGITFRWRRCVAGGWVAEGRRQFGVFKTLNAAVYSVARQLQEAAP